MQLFETQKYTIGLGFGAIDGVAMDSIRIIENKPMEVKSTMVIGKMYMPFHETFKQPTTYYIFFCFRIIIFQNNS